MSIVIPPTNTVQVTVQTPALTNAEVPHCELIQLKEIIAVLYQRIMILEHTLSLQLQALPPMLPSTVLPPMPPLEIPASLEIALKKQKVLKKTKAKVKRKITKLKKTTSKLCEKNDAQPKKTTKTINLKPKKPSVIVVKKQKQNQKQKQK
mgnify:CR=1 FL=1|tara:strand:+ start:41 stop:490 length:450 start_codon:yes stop_codon:yes gene_type:complete